MKIQFKKLPLATIILATIFAVGLIVFVGAFSKKDAFSQLSLWGGKETVIESQNKDMDNDGLLDWQENLYNTDPSNPDTDADGYLDGEEINSGHNPLVKGPNDNQAFFPLPIGDKYNVTNKVFSDIESVFKSYIEQKSEYATDHPEITTSQEFLENTPEDTMNQLFKRAIISNESDWLSKAEQILDEMPEVFKVEISDNDIVISENNDQESIKEYADKLMAYLDSPDFFLKEANLNLLKDNLPIVDFGKIDDLIRINDFEINKLKETETPILCKEIQKQALKTSIILRNIFVSLRGYESDPLKAAIASNEFENALKEWEILVQEFNNLNKSQQLNLSL